MAQFLRGKQAGIQQDLSAGLAPELFALDHLARYGVNSQVGALAYDPVQSLLAVGTNESRYGAGQIYVYGQKRVCVVFNMTRQTSITKLVFCADRLVSLDSRNELTIFSLETKKKVTSYSPPGKTTALLIDPTLDYALIGLQNGRLRKPFVKSASCLTSDRGYYCI
jgi:syntaxin-binding protein 5